MNTTQTTTLGALQSSAPLVQSRNVAPGFTDLHSFELMQRAAKLLSSSTLVPAAYRANDEKKGANPNALANCVVALNMSNRMGADPLMVMQNLYIVEGRPSWSSQWIIAAINGCGRFSPLRFELKDLGQKEVEYETTKWVNRERVTSKHKAIVQNLECTAWAIERETGERIDSPRVSIEMAVKEGWYGKSGSKWQTMPEVMLRYRTASFFGKLYAPELLMGLQTSEEIVDVVDVDAGGNVTSISTESLRASHGHAVQVQDAAAEPAPEKPKRGKARAMQQPATVVDADTGEIHDAAPAAEPGTTAEPEQPPAQPNEPAAPAEPALPPLNYAQVSHEIVWAETIDKLDAARALIPRVTDPQHQAELHQDAARALAKLQRGEA